MDYIIFRPHNVYGEYQNIGDPYRNVIGIFMNQIMSGQPLTIFGDGTQTRAFSYVEPIARTIAAAPTTPEALCEVFNVGADKPYSVRELAEEVCRAFGQPAELKFLEARNEVLHAYSSHEKADRVFGASCNVSLEDGLKRMSEWAKTQGARTSAAFEGIEVSKNLPDSWRRLSAGE